MKTRTTVRRIHFAIWSRPAQFSILFAAVVAGAVEPEDNLIPVTLKTANAR